MSLQSELYRPCRGDPNKNMSHNAFWILSVMALLSVGGLAGHNKPSGVDHSLTDSSKLPVYSTASTWLSDQPPGGTSYIIRQDMPNLSSDMLDAKRSFGVNTSPNDHKIEDVDDEIPQTDGPTSRRDTTSGKGTTTNCAEFSHSFPEVQRALHINGTESITNALTQINPDTYNCTEVKNPKTIQSEPLEMFEKRPQIQEVSETTDSTSFEQTPQYPNRTLSNITDPTLTVQNQSYFIPEKHKARKSDLSSHWNKATEESRNKANEESRNKATEESRNKANEESKNKATEESKNKATEESKNKATEVSTGNMNVLMDAQRGSGLQEEAQIRHDHIIQMNNDTYPLTDHQVVDLKQESAKPYKRNSRVPISQFSLADILMPRCSNDISCLGTCDEGIISNNEVKDEFDSRNNYPGSFTELPEKDTSLMFLSDFNQAKVNLSSSMFSSVCPKEKSPKLCNCDRKCIIYGDCCSDVFLVCWSLFSSGAVESFITETHKELLISTNHGNIIEELRQSTNNSQKILDYLYANFGSCRVIDRIYNRRMMFVSRCPDMADASLKHSCEQSGFDQIPPVTATFGHVAIVFANRFCAQCHGVLQDEYTTWATSVMCDPALIVTFMRIIMIYDLEILLKMRICNITFRDTLMACQGRTCQEFERLTSQKEQQLHFEVNSGACRQVDALLCRSYYFNTGTHSNPHCQKCLQHGNTRNIEVKLDTPTTGLAYDGLLCPPDYQGLANTSGGIFLILAVSGSQLNYGRPSDPKPGSGQCNDSDVFDQVSLTCKALLCPVGHIPRRGQCASYTNVQPYNNATLQPPQIKLRISVWTYSDNISCQLFMSALLDSGIPNLFRGDINIHVYGLKKPLTETIHEFNQSRSHSTCVELDWECPTHNDTRVEIKLTLEEDTDLQTWQALEQFAENVFPGDYRMTFVSSQGDDHLVCAFGTELIQFTSFSLEEANGILQARVKVEGHQVYYRLVLVAYKRYFVKVGHRLDSSSEIISVCEASKLILKKGCLLVSYTLNETSRNISQVKGQYGEDNVDVKGNRVYVCLRQTSSLSATADNITLFHILSWAMAGSSIVCLIIMLSLYCLFPELLTLPGKMMASLAATMMLSLLSNSLTLVKIRHRHVCPVAGAVSHVLVLAQYGWMSAIAVNMALTFGPKTLTWRKSLHDKSFIRYSCLVWGTSLVLVLTAFILDILHEDPVEDEDSHTCSNITPTQAGSNNSTTTCSALLKANQFPRYGTPFCTWFSGPTWTQLAFVVIPYAISYVINVVCFAITLYGIHRSSQQVQAIGQRSHQRLQCIIYIKLSTAMGFTSALSFVKNLAQTGDALSYFLMSFILLQGVFLFLAFMTNRRLLSLVKKRFSNREKSLKSSTTLTVRG